MQNDLNIRQTMTSVISMALDKDSVKKFEEASARASEAAAKQSVAEFQEAFGSLADILNKALSKFNMPEIDISDMIKTSGPNEFKALGEKFSTKFAEGFKESLVLKSVFLKEIDAVNDALTRKQKSKSSEIKSNFQKEVDKLGDTSWTKTTIRGLGNKLGSIRSEFDAAENWEDQYVILLKYLQGYEALEKLYADAGKTIDDISEKHKTIGGFSIEQVKEARAEIETSLKNIFNKNQGQDLLGLTKDGRIDVRVNLIPDKKLGAKDIVGGDGTVEIKIKPKVDRESQYNLVRGVYEPQGGHKATASQDMYGASYWFANNPGDNVKEAARESYAKQYSNSAIIEAGTVSLNALEADFKDQDNVGFEEAHKHPFFKYLFPDLKDVDSFTIPGLRADDSDYAYQRLLNNLAGGAGFDMLRMNNIDDSLVDGVRDVVAVLQESAIDYKGEKPEYYTTEEFDNHTNRAILSQRYGASTRFFESTLERLTGMLREAQAIDAGAIPPIEDDGSFKYFTRNNAGEASMVAAQLPAVIEKITHMAETAKTSFERAIEPYGGFIDEEVKRGLPQTVKRAENGQLYGLVSEETFKDMVRAFYEKSQDSDPKTKAASQKHVDQQTNALLSVLPENLNEEGEDVLYNLQDLEELTDEAIENVTKFFAPYAIYSEDIASTYYKPLEVETNGAPGGVPQAALDAEKERAKKAEEEAERERKAREEAERKAAEEKQAREHAEAEAAKKAKIGDSFARLSTLYNDSKSAQDESKLNDILEERKRILQELFLIMDDGDEYDNDFAAQQNLNKEIEAKIAAIRANADTKNQKELTQPDALKKLSEYIRNSGKVPSEFFDDIIADSQLLSEDLKEILTTLKILDSQGNLKFESIHSGMSNLGGVTSETNTIISRDGKYIPKTKDLKPKLKQAREMGANVGDIIGAVVDKANNRIYELQRTMPGTIIPDNIEFLKATDEQILKLIKDLEILNEVGLHIDLLGDNILFDEEKGFSFIDLGTRPVDGEDEIKDVGTSLKSVLDKFALDFSNNPAFSEFQNSVTKIAHGLGIEIPQAAEVARQNIEKVSKANEGVATSANEVTEAEKKAARTAELVAEMESVGNVDDKTSVKELNAKQARLEEILQLLKNESLLTKEIQDRYNEINKIISDGRINHLFHSTKSQNTNAGSGTGDASRSELEAARNEADRLRNENQSLREDLNDEIHRSNQAEGDRAVAENKLAEAEEKNTKLQQAHAEERKALDNIIASKNDEITRLQAEKEYAVRETDSAYAIAYEERSRADEAEARANKLQEQLDKISAGKTSDGSKEQGGVSINKEELEGALKNIVYRVHVESSNVDGFNNEKKDFSSNVDAQAIDSQIVNHNVGQTTNVTAEEVNNLETVRAKVEEVTAKVQEKTQEFLKEQDTVEKVSKAEIDSLDKVEQSVNAIKKALNDVNTLLDNIKSDKNIVDGLNNVNITVNHKKEDNDKSLAGNGSKDDNPQIQTIVRLLERIKTHTHDTKRQIRDNLVPKIDEKFSVSYGSKDDGFNANINDSKKNEPPTSEQSFFSTVKNNDVASQADSINTLLGLYEKLGMEREALRDADDRQDAFDAAFAQESIDELEKYIALGEKSIEVTELLREQFRNSESVGADKWRKQQERAKASQAAAYAENVKQNAKAPTIFSNDLIKDYQRLGWIRAEAENTPSGEYLNSLNSQISELENTIKTEVDKLGLYRTEIAEYESKTIEAYNKHRQHLKDKEARKYDEARKKTSSDVFEGSSKSAEEFQNIIEKTKEYNKWSVEAAKANKEGEKAAYTKYANEALKARNDLLKQYIKTLGGANLSQKQQAELISLATDRQKKLNEVQKKQEVKDFGKQVKEAQNDVVVKKTSAALRKAQGVAFDIMSDEEFDKFDANFKGKVKEYKAEVDSFKEVYTAALNEIEKKGELSEGTEKALIKQMNATNAYTEELKELIAVHEKLNSDNVVAKATSNLSLESSLKAYENGLTDFVEKITKGRGTITGFDADTKTLRYTIKGVKGETIECSAAVDHLAGSYVALQNKSRQTETLFDRLKRKTGEVATYLTSSLSIYTIINEVKKGIQYIREIDAAMTELKKVTNETEETYERFLDTAAKTGAKLGATISEVTEATATFSKLGYNMNLAADMAEAAIVYKNVGDNIASTEDAANSIISTLKGFGMQASESMEVVDRFNEIGNRFAITSQGIGEALRLSASALNEGGNSLDESIAMITAANEVVNDPSSVGEKLADKKVAQNEGLTEKGNLVGKNM